MTALRRVEQAVERLDAAREAHRLQHERPDDRVVSLALTFAEAEALHLSLAAHTHGTLGLVRSRLRRVLKKD